MPAIQRENITTREMFSRISTAYAGTRIYKQNLSRKRAIKIAHAVKSEELLMLANSQVYWDQITGVERDGEELVYDLTVGSHHNFIVNDIVIHNSIEQDADVVLFIYRDKESGNRLDLPAEEQNMTEILVSKHRNGPLGTVRLKFDQDGVSFRNIEKHRGSDEDF